MSSLMGPIDAASSLLNEVAVEFDSFVKTCADLNDEDPPPWVHLCLVYNQRLQNALEAQQQAIHRFARPVLRDIDSLGG